MFVIGMIDLSDSLGSICPTQDLAVPVSIFYWAKFFFLIHGVLNSYLPPACCNPILIFYIWGGGKNCTVTLKLKTFINVVNTSRYLRLMFS